MRHTCHSVEQESGMKLKIGVNLRMCEESVKKDAHHLVFVLTTVFVLYVCIRFIV